MRSCFLYSEKNIMTITKICIPAYYNSFRASFFMLVFNKDTTDKIRNFLVAYQVLFLATFIAAIFEDILSYISYISILEGFFALEKNKNDFFKVV